MHEIANVSIFLAMVKFRCAMVDFINVVLVEEKHCLQVHSSIVLDKVVREEHTIFCCNGRGGKYDRGIFVAAKLGGNLLWATTL
jgi:hypothetical protein